MNVSWPALPHDLSRAVGNVLLLPVVAAGCLLLACQPAATETTARVVTDIPQQSDWVDCGVVLSAGEEGEWDSILWGGFAATAVKKDGTFYLYYQGANGYDDEEGTVTYRSIGVATSADGIRFTKYGQNPVVTWFPNGHLEEGATSGGAFLDAQGDVAIYYGANTWRGGSAVNADGRLAVSSNGYDFADSGTALNHADSALWGYGDELFPIIGIHEGDNWISYYIPNGTPQRGQLGVAWGSAVDALSSSAAAKASGQVIPTWGPGGAARIGPDLYALLLNDATDPAIHAHEVRTVDLSDPQTLSDPVARYQFEDVVKATFLFDDSTDTWFLYYRNAELTGYGVKVSRTNGRQAICATNYVHIPIVVW